MREVYTVSDEQMKEWEAICRAFAKKQGAKLVFVNENSMGLEYPLADLPSLDRKDAEIAKRHILDGIREIRAEING